MCTNQVEQRELNYANDVLTEMASSLRYDGTVHDDVALLATDCLTLHARLAAFEQLRAAAGAVHADVHEIRVSEDAYKDVLVGAAKIDALAAALASLPPASEKGGA